MLGRQRAAQAHVSAVKRLGVHGRVGPKSTERCRLFRGRSGIRTDNGTEMIAGPGDVTSLPSGHDAWIVGDEPAVVIDWYGASNSAKPA